MRLIVCAFILFISITKVQAGLDSLINLAYSLPNGNEKMEVYRSIYKQYKRTNVDTVIHFLKLQKSLATELNDQRNLGLAHFRLALINQDQGNYDTSVEEYLLAARIFRYSYFYELYAATLVNLGVITLTSGNYSSAITFFEKAAIVYDYFDNQDYLLTTYWNIGYCYMNLEDYDFANNYYLHALNISKELEDPQYIYETYNYLGELALEQSCYEDARSFYDLALTQGNLTANRQSIKAFTLNNIGNTYLKENKFEDAEGYFINSLTIKESLNDGNSLMITLLHLGNLEIKRGNLDAGISYLEKGIQSANGNIINLHLTDALKILRQGYNMADKNGQSIDGEKRDHLLAIWEKQHEKLAHLKQILESNEIQKTLYFRIEIDQKNAQIDNINTARYNLTIVLVFICLVTISGLFYYWKARKTYKRVSEKLVEIQEVINS